MSLYIFMSLNKYKLVSPRGVTQVTTKTAGNAAGRRYLKYVAVVIPYIISSS